MSRTSKIIIFSLILISSIIYKCNDDGKYEAVYPSSSDTSYNLEDEIFRIEESNTIIGINESLKIDFIMTKDGEAFSPPSFNDFIIVSGPSQAINNSWTDGVRSFSKTYTYILEPKNIGEFKIGKSSVEIEGEIYQTAYRTITVTKPVVNPDKSSGWEIYQPSNGFSPYDNYFGKGLYKNSTKNSILVSSPKQSDIVFLLKNVNTGKTIRNEYIRKGSKFNLTGIPYGTYSFSYFSGSKWSDQIKLKNGKIKGGFTSGKSFSKSDKLEDYLEFKTGYYGSWEITLTEVENGNLETQESSEDEFFN